MPEMAELDRTGRGDAASARSDRRRVEPLALGRRRSSTSLALRVELSLGRARSGGAPLSGARARAGVLPARHALGDSRSAWRGAPLGLVAADGRRAGPAHQVPERSTSPQLVLFARGARRRGAGGGGGGGGDWLTRLRLRRAAMPLEDDVRLDAINFTSKRWSARRCARWSARSWWRLGARRRGAARASTTACRPRRSAPTSTAPWRCRPARRPTGRCTRRRCWRARRSTCRQHRTAERGALQIQSARRPGTR
jgi:hypothetical protein